MYSYVYRFKTSLVSTTRNMYYGSDEAVILVNIVVVRYPASITPVHVIENLLFPFISNERKLVWKLFQVKDI